MSMVLLLGIYGRLTSYQHELFSACVVLLQLLLCERKVALSVVAHVCMSLVTHFLSFPVVLLSYSVTGSVRLIYDRYKAECLVISIAESRR